MAKATIELINALRETASRLRSGAHYAWGHHGACNCGNLVQVVTRFTEGEILRYAHTGTGEWTEMTEEFCPVTNAPLTLVITKLEEIGLTPSDIHHIEYLSDKTVLQNFHVAHFCFHILHVLTQFIVFAHIHFHWLAVLYNISKHVLLFFLL